MRPPLFDLVVRGYNLPMRTIWIIVKDGATAFGFWLVASALLIYFLGYPGRMLSLFLGLIFIVSFIGVTLKRLVNLATGARSGGAPSGVPTGAPEDAPGWKTCTELRRKRAAHFIFLQRSRFVVSGWSTTTVQRMRWHAFLDPYELLRKRPALSVKLFSLVRCRDGDLHSLCFQLEQVAWMRSRSPLAPPEPR